MEYISITKEIISDEDITVILEESFSRDINKVLIFESAISEKILDLKSGLCGTMLQKFVNYNIKAVFIVDEKHISDRFNELIFELNKTSHFGFFYSLEEAKKWISQ